VSPARGRGILATVFCAGAALLVAAPALASPRRYLVVPFENLSSERSLNWLGEALSLSLADRLEVLGMRTVTRSERIEGLESIGLPDGKPLTVASILKLASAVRADRIVTGSFTYDPNSGVVVAGRLLDRASTAQIWEGSRPGTLSGILGLMDPLVLEAAARDEARVSPAAPSALTSIQDPPLTVYEILIRGLQEADPEKRLESLRKGLAATGRSPALRRAIVFEQFESGNLPEALAALDDLDAAACPDAWRVHLLRARILATRGDIDGSIAALSRSIAAGDSAEAHLLLARLAASRGEKGRSRTEADIAAGLDPGNPDLPRVRALAGGADPIPR